MILGGWEVRNFGASDLRNVRTAERPRFRSSGVPTVMSSDLRNIRAPNLRRSEVRRFGLDSQAPACFMMPDATKKSSSVLDCSMLVGTRRQNGTERGAKARAQRV